MGPGRQGHFHIETKATQYRNGWAEYSVPQMHLARPEAVLAATTTTPDEGLDRAEMSRQRRRDKKQARTRTSKNKNQQEQEKEKPRTRIMK